MPVNRRRFLVLAASATAACGGASSSSVMPADAAPIPSPSEDAVRVPLREFPTLGVAAHGYFLLGRDARGLYAMSAVCTHEGCLVPGAEPCDGGCAVTLVCPCHGARFDGNGAVLGGPAPSPLVHYLLTLDGTDAVVDPNVIVDPSVRTAPTP